MLNLEKTTNLVKRELENDFYLLEILKEDLINIAALSRKLLGKIKEENQKATVESISIAIKRYMQKEKNKKISLALKRIIANTQLLTKNDVVHMTFRRDRFMLNKISQMSNKIQWDQDEIFFVNQGSGEITIVFDEKNKKLFQGCEDFLIESTRDLSILSLKESFQKEALNVPGLYSYFINQISRKGINLIEIISTLSQLTFVLRNDDLLKAYSLMNESINHFRKSLKESK